MGGNTFGNIFRITTFGESHGPGIGVVIDGCPPGISINPEDFQEYMSKRRPSSMIPGTTSRMERDNVKILSGVFKGMTTGAPILLFINNQDVKSGSYEILQRVFRPGHGDYTYFKKYGHYDFRGGGRYSARETVARVAAGVIAQKLLAPAGINIHSYTLSIGNITAERIDSEFARNNPFNFPDPDNFRELERQIRDARADGDSLGGVVETHINGCPPGLGEPVFDKLDADISKAVMSIGAVKGVEIGAGFKAAQMRGSENNDPILPSGFATNNAGGILGGISNGDEIIVRTAIKPIPSIKKRQKTITREGREEEIALNGRFDTCAIPRIIPVIEAMIRIVICDHYLRAKAVNCVKLPEEYR